MENKYHECKQNLSERISNYEYTSKNALHYMEILDTYLKNNKINIINNNVLKHQAHIKVEKIDALIGKKTYQFIKKTFPKNDGEYEYKVGRVLNQLKNEIPNFMYTFESNSPKKELILEYVNGITISQDILKSSSLSDDEYNKKYASIILQVFIALFTAFSHFGYVHNDLHQENVMIVEYPTERWINYHIRSINKTISIYTKYLPMIIDYGLSQIEEKEGKILITKGFESYELLSNYCIPIRDYVKFGYSLEMCKLKSNVFNLLFNDHPVLYSLFLHSIKNRDYLYDLFNILPSYLSLLGSRDKSIENMKNLYKLTTYDIILHLFNTLPSKIKNFIVISDVSEKPLNIPTFLIKDELETEFYKQLLYLYLCHVTKKKIDRTDFVQSHPSFPQFLNQLLDKRVNSNNKLAKVCLDNAMSCYEIILLTPDDKLWSSYKIVLKDSYLRYQTYILTYLK